MVFISWSGLRGHELATVLASWSKKVVQSVDPWISGEMERGIKWLAEIRKGLMNTALGFYALLPKTKMHNG
jgi:hypothetical protein